MTRLKRAGFTLLEMLIAITILAISATILLGLQSSALHSNAYGGDLSIAAMLARAKMSDLEYELLQEPFKEGFEEEFDGDFGDEGYDEIEWHAVVESIEIGDDASNSFVKAMEDQLFGTEDTEGSIAAAGGSIGDAVPMVITLLPQMINDLGMRIRRVTLTLEWEYMGDPQTLTVSQYIVQLKAPPGTEVLDDGLDDTLDDDGGK